MGGQGKVRVTAEAADGSCRISLMDTGPGVAEALRMTLFDRFVTTKGGSGAGLGLYASKQIVRAQGGTITLDETPGEGTRFVVTLPLEGGDGA